MGRRVPEDDSEILIQDRAREILLREMTESWYQDVEINATAQLSILETVRNHCPAAKVIFASTRQLYGKPEYLPVDENHPTKPVGSESA